MKLIIICALAALLCLAQGQEWQGQEEIGTTRGCNDSDCVGYCWTAGYSAGNCVEDRCRCSAPVIAREQEEVESLQEEEAHVCNEKACNERCKRNGKPGGFCKGVSLCYCYKK